MEKAFWEIMLKYNRKKYLKHRQLLFVGTLLFVLFAVSIVGYMFLEHYSFLEALYMTVITVTTVGFREIRPLDTGGILLTIGVILMGFLALAVSAQTIMSAVFEKILSRNHGNNKMEKQIASLEGHYIICGFGRVGEAAVEGLSRGKIDYVVIDINEEAAEKLRQEGELVLIGSATDEEILLKAGIKKAKGLLVLTSSEPENLYITLTARELNPTLQIIARGENRSSEHKLKRAGADEVISPYTFAGMQIAEKILLANNAGSMQLPETVGAPEKVQVAANSQWIGQPLSVVSTVENWRVLGVRRGKKDRLFPPKDLKLKRGDELLVLPGLHASPKIKQKQKTVLIVEDNRITATLYVRILVRENFIAKYVDNGFDAIQMITSEKPDVAVIDNMLPGMSGIEICRTIRENPELNSVRLILFTGDEHPETRRRALESGADAFLLKTSEASRLVEKIHSVLQQNAGSSCQDETFQPTSNAETVLPSTPQKEEIKDAEKTNIPIDFADAFDRCGNDWDFFFEMFGEFTEYIPEQIQKIKKAYAEQDWEMLHSEGHRFKGAAANFGATVLTDLARQVEEAGRNHEDVGIDDLIRQMEKRAQILRHFRDHMTPSLVSDLIH